VHIDRATAAWRCGPGHGNDWVCGKRGSKRRRSGEKLTTVHVLMRPDDDDRGNPRVRPRGEEGDGRLIAEQLEAMLSGRSAQQVTVEVVGLLMVVDPPADQADEALRFGEDDAVEGSLAAQLSDQPGVRSAQFLEGDGQAVDAGCCHALRLPHASQRESVAAATNSLSMNSAAWRSWACWK
jgi:hypothetical protein